MLGWGGARGRLWCAGWAEGSLCLCLFLVAWADLLPGRGLLRRGSFRPKRELLPWAPTLQGFVRSFSADECVWGGEWAAYVEGVLLGESPLHGKKTAE